MSESSIKFFTPVRYGSGTCSHCIQESIDGYFYLGGKSAFVVPGKVVGNSQEVVIREGDQNKFKQVILTALKIVSYMTVVIPLIMLITKAIYRHTHKFHTSNEQPPINPPNSLSPSSPPIEDPKPREPSMHLERKYFSNAQEAAFWDSYLDSYIEAIDKWDNIKGLSFLKEELQAIKQSLDRLLKNLSSDEVPFRKQIEDKVSDSSSDNNSNPVDDLEKFIGRVLEKTNTSLMNLDTKIEQKTGRKVMGFHNTGNICYISSALQPLLAVQNFRDLIPNSVAPEPEDTFAGRKNILDSFKEFFQAWKNGGSSRELGEKIGNLRKCIFKVGLLEGGFLDRAEEGSFQDAGQFFELIIHVLGRGFKLETSRIPIQDDAMVESRGRVEQEAQGIFYLQLPGNSLQEIINKYEDPPVQSFSPGNEWRIQDIQTGEEVMFPRYKETQKIVGDAPEILVVRVNNHIVNPEQDRNIDFSALFKDSSQGCRYELTGFSQNHCQVHWTSVVYDGKCWKHCDDRIIKSIKPTERDFRYPANYMVYRKISKELSCLPK